MPDKSMFRNIKIKTTPQEITLEASVDLTLEEVLRINKLPTSLFQGYILNTKDPEKRQTPIPLNIKIKEIDTENEIIIQCIRNTDLRQVLPQKIFYKKANDAITILRDLDIEEKECSETIYEINETEAKNIVTKEVENFMKEFSKAKKIILGISGGGDSNTLVRSLKNFSINNKNEYICFTLVFDPIWPDSGARRASELCEENKIEHYIYNAKDIEKVLKMKGKLEDFFDEFSKLFGDNTSHFFATYIISLVAKRLCKKYKTDEYGLGYNREDILAELIFSLMNGQKPLSFPMREFGGIKLLMPLWKIPKRILDACYPKYSIKNYQERIDKTTAQRSIIYYLAHAIEDTYYDLGLSLMVGIKKLFSKEWSKLKHDKEYDLYISEYAEKDKIDEVKNLLKKYFTIPID